MSISMRLVLLTLLALLAPAGVRAGGDEVVVIYNSRVPESQAVAAHYAAARRVPAKQVFGFALTANEVISRAEFRADLQQPLAKALAAAGLWKLGQTPIPASATSPAHSETRVVAAKIRYAVLCYGMPLKIAPGSVSDDEAPYITRPELRRDDASVDSELAWLPLIHTEMSLVGPLPNSVFGSTNRLLLSPTNGLLLVTRLDGPTAEIASNLVAKAILAERDGLWGRAYIDTRNEPTNASFYPGDVWMREGAAICRNQGFDVDVDTNLATFPVAYPMSHIAIYAGWYDGDVSGPFTLPAVEFMTGAIAYHLHSYSAATLRSTTQSWCGPLLAKGATCTMGCVNEPYLQFTPHVGVFLNSLACGYTFGEAAWAAQPALSWQTTVIGDPLYQPFKEKPIVWPARLARTQNPLVEWAYERLVNLDLIHGARLPQLEGFLENLPATARSAVLTEKLAEIYAALGKPSSAIDTWQNALKLNPSPQQRLRLRQTLGEKLLALGRQADAIENFEKLLAEAPDYAGKAKIEAELHNLAGTNATEIK